MTKLIQNHFEIIQRKPDIPLEKDVYVSRSSTDYLSPANAVAWAAREYNAPLVTADLGVLTRSVLGSSPLKEGGLDNSHLRQCTSTYALFGCHSALPKGAEDIGVAISDLPVMYQTLEEQVKAAEKIGEGCLLPWDDEFVQLLLDKSGRRKAKFPNPHWPHIVDVGKAYKNDSIAKAVFPFHAGTNSRYLSGKKFSIGKFYLLDPEVPTQLTGGKKVAVRPLRLDGNDDYDDVNSVSADSNFYDFGLARAGSVVGKKIFRRK